MTVVDLKRRAQTNAPEVIRRLVRLTNLTQAQLGQELGLSGNVTQQRLTETSQWTYPEIVALAGLLGLPIDLFDMEPKAAILRAMNEYDFPFKFEKQRAANPDERGHASSGQNWKIPTSDAA